MPRGPMIIHKIVMVRPREEIEFFIPPESVKVLRSKFKSEEKIIDIKIIISDDQLTKTIITAFRSQDNFREYANSPELNGLSGLRQNYNEQHGIVELSTLFDETGTLLNFTTIKNKK